MTDLGPVAGGHDLPDHETFYSILTASNAGIYDADEQARLREAAILIAGCEAVGHHAADNLARAGIERFTLADERVATVQRLARLVGGPAILGENCAVTLARHIAGINPYCDVHAHVHPPAPDDLGPLLSRVDLVVDALDCEGLAAFQSRLMLHQAARAFGVPVVAGFNIGSSAWTLLYDYRDDQQEVLDGAYDESDLAGAGASTPIPILMSMVSLSRAPADLLKEAERILLGQRDELPHSAAAGGVTGSIVSQVAIDVLLDRPVRRMIAIDLEEAVRPPGGLRRTGRRLVAFYSLRRHLRHRRREGRLGVYSPLDDEAFQGLRAYMEERTYEAGSVIVRQGDPADEFFVIVEGRVNVEYEERDEQGEVADYTVIAELGPGDYFGEMALLADTPRAASVVVAERCRVLALSRGAFEIYLEESGAAAHKVRGEALARLRENRAVIGC
ncbi:MAG TPA: cyclic nucleotide-binding domain-containing protein [Thermomicrobiales bacterium]|nr:cyclic nucleotide-binding domain-containing protein [Thermomicrobiales bacterium]